MAYDTVPPAAAAALSPGRGFLPNVDPLAILPARFAVWEEVAAQLPKLLVSGKARAFIERMPQLDSSSLEDGPELRRAMLLLSFLGHSYVWGEPAAAARLPATLAVPWHAVATRLGRPPILSYASYALDNWRRLEPAGPIALGNLALLQNFLGGADEEWFITVHIDIEARAGVAMDAVLPAQARRARARPRSARSAPARHRPRARRHVRDARAHAGVVRPGGVLPARAPVHPRLEESPRVARRRRLRRRRRSTGARRRSSAGRPARRAAIVPVLDALLGIGHLADPLREYLMEMRQYMPPAHRAFMEAVEQGPSLRDVVLARTHCRRRACSRSTTAASSRCGASASCI